MKKYSVAYSLAVQEMQNQPSVRQALFRVERFIPYIVSWCKGCEHDHLSFDLPQNDLAVKTVW